MARTSPIPVDWPEGVPLSRVANLADLSEVTLSLWRKGERRLAPETDARARAALVEAAAQLKRERGAAGLATLLAMLMPPADAPPSQIENDAATPEDEQDEHGETR